MRSTLVDSFNGANSMCASLSGWVLIDLGKESSEMKETRKEARQRCSNLTTVASDLGR